MKYFARALSTTVCAAAVAVAFPVMAQQAPAAPSDNPLAALANAAGVRSQNLDPDELAAAIADRVAGFAGIANADSGEVRVMFTSKSQAFERGAPRAMNALPNNLGSMMQSLGVQPRMAQAQFDARQMLTFKRAAFAQGAKNGVLWVDIDEMSNRVRIGVDRALEPSQLDALHQRMVQAGLPASAFVLESSEPYVQMQSTGGSIRGQNPPLAGGAQIQFRINGGGASCSVGVPAVRNGVTGFVTASHCSDKVYGTDSSGPSQYSAPTLGQQPFATESIDPGPINCEDRISAGTAGSNCRRSDALFVRTRSPNDVQLGSIYQANAALTITGSLPVIGTLDFASLNQRVAKTGRTTGTTSGRVTQTCVDVGVSEQSGQPPSYGVLCATVTNVPVQGGDSGSALYVPANGGARVTGILSFGSSDGTSGFSPWGMIRQDLGALTVR
jgi:hypothetical protein